ncbi:GntR family transcriptional regulator [Isobaculum melis]|uniref:GntR family transcriptional regulator n=1 Tax=Isobaculum melis TaxID=142588 RepID=A0A1H9TGT5_9LACT|nr:GntR family transcriptional regulator [Isobaculum melis]SER96059.1 GntR family transcriptional regulator [Isobaculum melis]
MKYQHIVHIVSERIKNDEYNFQYALPNQQELATEFGVSRMTVKKALDILKEEGVIYSSRGLGTFVVQHEKLQKISTYQKKQQTKQFSYLKQMLSFEKKHPHQLLQQQLAISAQQNVYAATFIRYRNERPYALEHWFIPEQVIPGITQETLEQDLYHYIEFELGLKLGDTSYTISAVVANEVDKLHLNCTDNHPILKVEKLSFLRTGCPFLYRICHYQAAMKSYQFFDAIKKNK